MRISQNEVYRMAQKALEGSSAPIGADREGAQMVAWLEAHGLPGLALLAASLDRLAGAFAGLALPAAGTTPRAIDCAGRPAIALAPGLIDLVAAQAAASPQGRARLTAANLRWPLFILPAALRRAERGAAIAFDWTGCGAAVHGFVTAGGDPALQWAGRAEDRPLAVEGPVTVVIECALGEAARRLQDPAPAGTGRQIDGAALGEAEARTLARGIEVEDTAWRRVAQRAQAVLVPASEESRARGAGGGDAND